MERLKRNFEKLMKAYTALEEAIEEYNDSEERMEKHSRMIQDSVIKRFEFCYELTWKYLKLYISDKFGIDIASPKKVFKECLTQKIITDQEAQQFILMVGDRNLTSHTYDETVADRVSLAIPDHYELMKTVLQKVKPEN